METLESAREPLAIFSSFGVRNATVGIPRADFGYELPNAKDASPEEFASIYFEPSGEPAGLKIIEFKDGSYEAFLPVIVDCLRRHPQNKSNGGRAFMEVPREALRQGRELAGGVGAKMPEGGLTDEDQVLLASLTKYADQKMPPKALGKPIRFFGEAVTRFQVAGVRAPVRGEAAGTVKVRVMDLMEILESAGIRLDSPMESTNDGRGNS